MSNNENVILRDKTGAPIPQTLDARTGMFDVTKGSDGAQHMKIVDQNGNPISTQNVKDADVKAELESVKAELQSLKEHTFNTQLTGSNVEQDVIIAGGRRDEITLLPREVRQSGDFTTFNVPSGVSSILIVHVVYQVSGSFSEDEGHRFTVAPFEGSVGRVLFRTWYEYRELMDHHTGNSSISNGSYTYMFNPYAEEMPNPRQNVLIKIPVVFNDMRITLSIDGHFEENEGIDSEVICRFNY